MSYADITTRIGQIQSQLAALQTAFDPAAQAAAASGSGAAGATGGLPTGSSSFAAALAQAQATPGTAAGDVGSTLSATATSRLTSAQQQFASRLAQDTGLDPTVISAWLLAEENGGAAQARQAQSNNDWLNIGYTGAGTYGAADAIWNDPSTAADATAGWLKGQNTIPGYGTASAGIQAILQTAGQPAASQIAALQNSGWAGSGYPDLPALVQQLSG